MRKSKIISAIIMIGIYSVCLLSSCSPTTEGIAEDQISHINEKEDSINYQASINELIKKEKDSCIYLRCYLNNKLIIPFSLIKNETLIDTIYLREGAFFIVDTTYKINSNYSLVIMNNNDGLVCSNKFILVIENKFNKNTDCILAGTDCDRDGDNKYYSTKFSIKGQEILIYRKFAAKGVEINDSKIIETKRYYVDPYGKLKEK